MKNKKLCPTAPKKTWGGRWFPQGSFFVATFVAGRQLRVSKAPGFLAETVICHFKRHQNRQ